MIVVDDGSEDDTACVLAALAAARANLITIRHEGARGYAAALRTGFAVALSTGHEWVVYGDADSRFDPVDVDLLVGAARADGVEIADRAHGFKAFRRDALARLTPLLTADHAGIARELLCQARDLGLRITDVCLPHTR